MPTTYPITFPASPGIKRINWTTISLAAVAASPFTLEAQIQEHDGDGWMVEVTLPSMTREQFEPWIGSLLSLRSALGTFMLGDPLGANPRGLATGSPVVYGDTPKGADELTIGGMTAFTGNIWAIGDYIQIGVRLHKILPGTFGDHTSDVNGRNLVQIFPKTREAIEDGTTIITTNPKGLFRLSDPMISWSVDERKVGEVSFSAVEAL